MYCHESAPSAQKFDMTECHRFALGRFDLWEIYITPAGLRCSSAFPPHPPLHPLQHPSVAPVPAMGANRAVDGQPADSVVTPTTSSSQSSNSKRVGTVSIEVALLHKLGLISPSDQLEEAVVATFVKPYFPRRGKDSKKTKSPLPLDAK